MTSFQVPSRLFSQSFLFGVPYEFATDRKYVSDLIQEIIRVDREVIIDVQIPKEGTKDQVRDVFKSMEKSELIYLRLLSSNQSDQNDWILNSKGEHVGFLAPDEHTLHVVGLYHLQHIGSRREVMIIYDGQPMHLEPNQIPESLKYYKENMFHGRDVQRDEVVSLIPKQMKMSTSDGDILVSEMSILGGPVANALQGALPPPAEINFQEQWLTGNSDLKAAQTIGYVFKRIKFNLERMELIARVGPTNAPAIQVPRPKVIQVLGLVDGKWVEVTYPFELSEDSWAFLSPLSLELKPSEEENFNFSGIKLVISEWYPGANPQMETGLMRFTVYGKIVYKPNQEMIEVPFITPPEAQLIYAQYNPRILEHPRNKYRTINLPVIGDEPVQPKEEKQRKGKKKK